MIWLSSLKLMGRFCKIRLTESSVAAGCLRGYTKVSIAGISSNELHRYFYPGFRQYLDQSHHFRKDDRFGGICTQLLQQPIMISSKFVAQFQKQRRMG